MLALLAALIAGIANGIGVGIFKVHPLIMTLGIGLVILGLMNVYQLIVVQNGTNIPPAHRLARLRDDTSLPAEQPLHVRPDRPPDHRWASATPGSGGCCSRSATIRSPRDSPVSGCGRSISGCTSSRRCWRPIAGILIAGLVKTASLALVDRLVLPAVAAAVIGGTSIMGGRGGYSGTIIGALILTVLTSLLIALQMPEAVRQILFGAIIVVVAAVYTRIVDVS